MGAWHRIEIALDSPLGMLLVSLVVAALALLTLYWLVAARKRHHDALAYRYEEHYRSADALLADMPASGEHKPVLFGRETVVRLDEHRYGLCLVPPPDIANAYTSEQLGYYLTVIEGASLPRLSRYVWRHSTPPLVVVQDQLVDETGSKCLTLREYMLDSSLSVADTEILLLELAQTLTALHNMRTETGKHLYHGMLLPTNIVLGFNPDRTIRQLTVAHHGLAFAIGPQLMAQRLASVESGKLALDSHTRKELLEFLGHLAPEQRNEDDLHTVGPAADRYAYGALAVALFTKRPFSGVESVNWDAVPETWRGFLQRCLSPSPPDRPCDLLEIRDRLDDPELSLTWREPTLIPETSTPSAPDVEDADESMLDTVVDVLADEGDTSTEVQKKIDSGKRALRVSRWQRAQKLFQSAELLEPDNPDVLVHLAIAYYKQGQFEQAEHYYRKVKDISQQKAKLFRRHIALRT